MTRLKDISSWVKGMPAVTLSEKIYLVDSIGYVPTVNETIGISDRLFIFLPKITLPPEVVDALRSHPSQKLYQYMQTASIEIQKIRIVSEKDYVLAEDINQPKSAINAVIDYLNEAMKWDSSNVVNDAMSDVFDAQFAVMMVPEAKAGDIYDPDWHNNLVAAIKALVRAVRRWFPVKLGPEITTNLVERKRGDIIAPDDHNTKRYVLDNVYNVMSYLSGFIIVLMEYQG